MPNLELNNAIKSGDKEEEVKQEELHEIYIKEKIKSLLETMLDRISAGEMDVELVIDGTITDILSLI
jgi:uncharacterized LabA/DUF88 family protein